MNDVENIPNKALLSEEYHKNRTGYEEALAKVVREISRLLQRRGLHPTIKSRVKDFESFLRRKLSC